MRRLLFLLLTLLPLNMLAQLDTQDAVRQAERIFSFLQYDQTDSLYERLADDMRAMVDKDQLSGAMKQAEQLAGAYQEHGEWTVNLQDTLTICSSVCRFENGELSAVIVFDRGWMIHGLHLMPRHDEVKHEPLPEGIVELTDTVRAADGLALPCIITLSGLTQHPPIVVMVHGSGPLDSDETVMANKPFRDLARLLALRGISTLRYDKRTYVSHEPVASVEVETINDALAAIALARTYNNNVYLLGHSLGAMLAPAIAEQDSLQGIVMMAAPARDMEQVVIDQVENLSPPEATKEQKAQALADLHSQMPHYFVPQHQVQKALRLHIPILLLQGERDYQVTMKDFRIWQKKLRKKKNATLIAYPALNHLFIPGEGPPTPQEYMKKGSVSEQVADDIATFLRP
ncbi:MAG: alpha/beta fold hydrolase [Prevotella sp.]|nr:alpha/beta fold hydrolase [Prevotella sp.]